MNFNLVEVAYLNEAFIALAVLFLPAQPAIIYPTEVEPHPNQGAEQ